MARPESQAVGGFFPTPPHLVPRIARLLSVADAHTYALVDPCAGDGAAVLGLGAALFDAETLRQGAVGVFACEMEATRFKALEKRRGSDHPWGACHFVHGDAFRLRWELEGDYGSTNGASLLFLNPPYDHDPEHGRLEERFLQRFAGCLADGGVLVLVVPHYALEASATTLAREFEGLSCFRFPEADFGAFRQVVLVARKRATLMSPDERVAAQVRTWAATSEAMPELPPDARGSVAEVPGFGPYAAGFKLWKIARLDLTGLLARSRPWHVSDRGGRVAPIEGIVPSRPALELLSRTYPVAMPPKPAHIAAGIAAGVFNGARVEPDKPGSGLPSLLVKGNFDREFVTVDEKQNKEGEKTGELQVQQPKLVVTVLDLQANRYHTLKSEVEVTGARDVALMTAADLLACYGRGLRDVMLEQCPVLHDPARPGDALALPELPRRLYTAQAHAVMAAVKLLGGVGARASARRWLSCFVLGEIGSGKSTVALATAATIGARRVLVLCPPHLLDSWRDQAAAVVPGARVVILREPSDVDDLAAADDEGMVIAILSRETAKLGHAWAGVGSVCPSCGGLTPADVDLAKKRARCTWHTLTPVGPTAAMALELAAALLPVFPDKPDVQQLLTGRTVQRYRARCVSALERAGENGRAAPWKRVLAGGALHRVARRLARALGRTKRHVTAIGDMLMNLLAALRDDALLEEICRRLYAVANRDLEPYGPGADLRNVVRRFMLIASRETQDRLGLEDGSEGWIGWRQDRDALARGDSTSWANHGLSSEDGGVRWCGRPLGDPVNALVALVELSKHSQWKNEACGEPLYQAIPEPRRYPLATYLARRHPKLLDLLVLDEGHEYAGDGSAQGFAAHRLVGLGIPTMLMTGSVMSGYADSLFANQWALDPDFRREFPRGTRAEFVRRYGYIKRLVEMKEGGKTVTWGAVSDRCERTERTVGQAPGVLPLFVLRYLLRRAVTLHKSDLALDLPKCRELVDVVDPGDQLRDRFESLQTALIEQIKADRFGPMSGKLWGQMAELPSYLDRATEDTGNVDGGAYEIAYPADCGGDVVAREEPLPASTILPKERWMLDTIRRELAEGRRVMVFAWHATVLPRLARLIEAELGEACPVLEASKVQASKRQAWIDREIIAKGRRVLAVNPVCVQTGLNNLVWFSTEIWMQNPAVNAVVYRQATGRVDRIGQTLETRILFPVYADTAQAALHKLLLHKVGVSMSTDGLDAESALSAAGVGSTGFDGFAVGQLLYEMLVGERKVPEVELVPMPAPPVAFKNDMRAPEPKSTAAAAAKEEPMAASKYEVFKPAISVEVAHIASGATKQVDCLGRYSSSFEVQWPMAGLCAFHTTTGLGQGRMREWKLTVASMRTLRKDPTYNPPATVLRKGGTAIRPTKADLKPDTSQQALFGGDR